MRSFINTANRLYKRKSILYIILAINFAGFVFLLHESALIYLPIPILSISWITLEILKLRDKLEDTEQNYEIEHLIRIGCQLVRDNMIISQIFRQFDIEEDPGEEKIKYLYNSIISDENKNFIISYLDLIGYNTNTLLIDDEKEDENQNSEYVRSDNE